MNPKQLLTDPRAYIAAYFAREKITARQAQGKPYLRASIKLSYREEFLAHTVLYGEITPLKRYDLDDAFEEYMAIAILEEIKAEVEAIRTSGEDLTELHKFVKAATGEEKELDIAVIAHWIWQVKRRAFGKEVVWHVMPVLYGPQGSGKTKAIKRLTAPIATSVSELALDKLSDDRWYKAFSEYLVLFFDELQQIKKASLETLKHQISADINTYRPMKTNDAVNVPMRSSCIGASNKPLSASFSDSTGMRRFYELQTVAQFPKDVINGLDYLKLWKGVDENRAEGYMPKDILKQLHAKQAELVDKEPLDEFIQDYQLAIMGPDAGRVVSRDELYDSYVVWCGKYGVKPTSAQWVTKGLKARLFDTYEENNLRYFRVSAKCVIGKKLEGVK